MKKVRSKIRKHFYVVTYVVNIAMIPAFVLCLVTGIIMFPGLLELLHIRARKLPMETFAFLHDWSGLALGAGILFHLYLHWRAFWQFLRLKVFQLPPKSRAKHKANHTEVAQQGS